MSSQSNHSQKPNVLILDTDPTNYKYNCLLSTCEHQCTSLAQIMKHLWRFSLSSKNDPKKVCTGQTSPSLTLYPKLFSKGKFEASTLPVLLDEYPDYNWIVIEQYINPSDNPTPNILTLIREFDVFITQKYMDQYPQIKIPRSLQKYILAGNFKYDALPQLLQQIKHESHKNINSSIQPPLKRRKTSFIQSVDINNNSNTNTSTSNSAMSLSPSLNTSPHSTSSTDSSSSNLTNYDHNHNHKSNTNEVSVFIPHRRPSIIFPNVDNDDINNNNTKSRNRKRRRDDISNVNEPGNIHDNLESKMMELDDDDDGIQRAIQIQSAAPTIALILTEEHKTARRENTVKLFNNKHRCDVTFIVGEERKEIKCHRILLSAISPVFDAMLYQKGESGPNLKKEIIDIDPDAFIEILKYSYHDNPNITPQNVISIKQICDKFEIKLVSSICDEYFEACISPQNICNLLSESTDAKIESYTKHICDCLAKPNGMGTKCKQILASNGFLKMSQAALILFLQSDGLCIKEEQLFEAAVEWVKARIKSVVNTEFEAEMKSNLLKSLCPYIRFGLMDGTYFVKEVKPVLINCLSTEDIMDILCYIQCNDEKCGRFSIKSRGHMICRGLPFSVSMSSKYDGPPNDYKSLISLDYSRGCLTEEELNPWIEVSLAQPMRIKRIEIAAADDTMPGIGEHGGIACIDGAEIKYKPNGRWVRLILLRDMKQDSMFACNLDIKSQILRIIQPGLRKKRLAIGCLRVYGFEEDYVV